MRKATDTITSQWFTVNNDAHLVFKIFSLGNPAHSFIQRRETNITFPLIMPTPNSDTSGLIVDYHLINGQGFEYRYVFMKTDTNAAFRERLFIDELPVQDTVFGRTTANNEIIVDLSGHNFKGNSDNGISINLYPNPADGFLYVTAYFPVQSSSEETVYRKNSQITLRIYSNLGAELFRQLVKSGETTKISIGGFPAGVYFMRADESKNEFGITKLPFRVEPFVIER